MLDRNAKEGGSRYPSPANAQDQPASQSQSVTPSISLPKGGGAIRGIGEKFAANPVTGTGSMTVPIFTSPGRSGFGPQLSLAYDSGAGNGPFGYGWSLSLPSITRKTDKGLPKYQDADESDVFILSGAEDLVPVFKPNTMQIDEAERDGYRVRRYRPRIEGLFARIERWTKLEDGTSHWRSISKDNITTLYGKDNNSRISDPSDPDKDHPTRIFSWLICESYDDKGNAIAYKYKEENLDDVKLSQAHEANRTRSANRYLKRIKYCNKTQRQPNEDLALRTDWLFEVVFDYGEHYFENDQGQPTVVEFSDNQRPWLIRQDPFSSYRAGFEVRTYRLCRRVLMFHHFPNELDTPDYLVHATLFDYRESPIASFITSVTQAGYVKTNGTYLKKAMPPVEFTYTEATIDETVRDIDRESLDNLPYGLDGARYQWVDLDGEGISGILTEQADGWFYKRNLSPITVKKKNGQEITVAGFAPVEVVASKPSLAQIAAGRQQFLDLAGDGQLDLVQFDDTVPGFYERTESGGWENFTAFESLPTVNWQDPNLKFVDLTGDGHADVLITEDEAFTWYPSLAEAGFGPSEKVLQALDEEKGPRLVFGDGTQSIYLADLSGDGLTDLVRIRNGEVCYWPNLGYGRFGAKVTMDNAPWFDAPDLFDQQRIRLADIDGSGTTDLIYLGANQIDIYRNNAGNSWSDGERLTSFPPVDNLSSVQAVDLLGNGTACLVWSSPLLGDARRPMRYIDLMGGQKPHLLVKTINNLGAETHVDYAPSTKFYLQDKLVGTPWITRLPFPVHVVERVETYDRISRNHFVTRYAYHHGYFDGEEREFRGFGMIEQFDTEEFAALTTSGELPPDVTNVEEASHVPPVRTKTWFHTGAFIEGGPISKQFEHEYYHEGDPSLNEGLLSDEQLEAVLLDDTVLPTIPSTDPPLTPEEAREAYRSLKGSVLRQEIYALDRRPDGSLTEESDRPYSVSERSYNIKRLQPRGQNRHAVFFSHARETVDFHYERRLVEVAAVKRADPRVSHALTLKVDDYGNVERSIAIGYRRRPAPDLQSPEQEETCLTLTVNRFANRADEQDWYRIGLPVEARTFEMVKPPEPTVSAGLVGLLTFARVDALFAQLFPPNLIEPPAASTWPYEKWDWRRNAADAPAETRLRLIEHVRTLYRPDDMGAAGNDLLALLSLGKVEPLALPGESYKLAFNPGLLDQVYVRSGQKLLPANPADVLKGGGADRGGYVDLDNNGQWWIPSGRIFFSPGSADTPAQELAFAREHFFLPHRFRDPFGSETTVAYDSNASDPSRNHNLLVVETRDPLGDVVTVETTDDNGQAEIRNDYRVLQPYWVTDPNGNRTRVAFDALGMVVGTAVMGKPGQNQGDILESSLVPDLALADIQEFVKDPRGQAASLLGKATIRVVYDLDRYQRSGQPPFAATLARETHFHDPGGAQTKIQISFSYSDGFGREIQKKIQAERGDAPQRGPDIPVLSGEPLKPTGDIKPGALVLDASGKLMQADTPQRWVGTGRTVYNNKGKPVKQYEPFFSSTHLYEEEPEMTMTGVTPILFYDPLERLIVTLHPNHTYEKVVFDPWQQTTYDVNDTVLVADPKTDADVGDFFGRLPDADYLPTWHELRTNPLHAAEFAARYPDATGRSNETSAAAKAAIHAETPTTAHFDTLGRTFLTLADNGPDPTQPDKHLLFPTRVELDIEGNQRSVTDALGRKVMTYDYDMLSTKIHQVSMEAGERWILNDVTGKPIRTWDSRGHMIETNYDELRRPVEMYVSGGDDIPAGERALAEKTVYGESQGAAKNHRGKIYQHYDGAGVVTNVEYDFKGNLQETSRKLVQEYKKQIDWKQPPTDDETFTATTQYDALNRPTVLTTPHNAAITPSEIRPIYNEANLLNEARVQVRGGAEAAYVTNIDYNAKGQRELIEYGNGTNTTYEYDPITFRLTHLKTMRTSDNAALQDLHYTYDPAGNITHIRDAAQQTIYFRNKIVEPSAEYTYDAIYRLIEATGREHLGQVGGKPIPHSYNDAPRVGVLSADAAGRFSPYDGNAMGTYIERYLYDAAGNFQQMKHIGADPANPGWTRTYAYNEASLIEPAKQSNRLSSTTVGNGIAAAPEAYTYDAHGNMTKMPHLQVMQWDFKDQLRMTQRQAVTAEDTDGLQHQGERTWYVYDSAGQRVRKVTERQASAGGTPTRMKERLYLGGFEIYREYENDGVAVSVERETLHIMDDKQRIALVETRTQGNDPAPQQLIRYQFENHLGSANLELDDQAQIISYEEYYPYGSTSYQAVDQNIKAAAKRYRYTGKERDEESGLYYHGARYYAPWLGRWTGCDPAGSLGGINLYEFVHGNPVKMVDPSGMNPESVDPKHDPRYNELRQQYTRMDVDQRLEFDRTATPEQKRAVGYGSPVASYTAATQKDITRPDKFAGVLLLGRIQLEISLQILSMGLPLPGVSRGLSTVAEKELLTIGEKTMIAGGEKALAKGGKEIVVRTLSDPVIKKEASVIAENAVVGHRNWKMYMARLNREGTSAAHTLADWLRRQGVNVLGEEVGARTLGELRKMDILAEISGKLFNLESKIRSAERPLLQKAKDIAMEHFGARLVGKNAPKELLNQFIRKIETIVIKH